MLCQPHNQAHTPARWSGSPYACAACGPGRAWTGLRGTGHAGARRVGRAEGEGAQCGTAGPRNQCRQWCSRACMLRARRAVVSVLRKDQQGIVLGGKLPHQPFRATQSGQRLLAVGREGGASRASGAAFRQSQPPSNTSGQQAASTAPTRIVQIQQHIGLVSEVKEHGASWPVMLAAHVVPLLEVGGVFPAAAGEKAEEAAVAMERQAAGGGGEAGSPVGRRRSAAVGRRRQWGCSMICTRSDHGLT